MMWSFAIFCMGLITGVGGYWAWQRPREDQVSPGLALTTPFSPGLAPPDFLNPSAPVPDSPAASPSPGLPGATLNPNLDREQDREQDLEQDREQDLEYVRAVLRADFHGGFLARTSHELRSPLSSLMSLHQIILNNLCDDPQEERLCLQQAYDAAQRLLTMLELITQVSKLESGRTPLHIQTVTLFQLLQDLQMLTRLQAANRNFNLAIDLPDPQLQAIADPTCLRQALLCLLNRAMQEPLTQQAWLFCHVLEGASPDASPQVALYLIDDRPLESWQDPLQLSPIPTPDLAALVQELRQQPSVPCLQLSPGMLMWIAHSFITLGGGTLNLMQLPPELLAKFSSLSLATPTYAFQCCFPLGSVPPGDSSSASPAL